MILNWYESDFFYRIQSFHEFANFYFKFVKQYSSIAHSLIDTTKIVTQRAKKDITLRKTNFLTSKARRSFQRYIATFTSLLFLINFDAKKQIKLFINISSYWISKILLEK